ncbi:peroxisomal membrane protein 4 [Exidia glandulosa HHB12029]|uniref:Peroxisomal membrane protein 4 n=1 Tax=Exidia glandulosa HHB12029 TaxID=1314781 RepID=A0A165PEH0_EXIGL|nr:peroxisomal membrane protein 4 [Exidia glandulosa HHB12029]
MVLDTLNALAASPALHDYLAVIKGARNGAVYGAKIRFPHAVVMAILFGRGDWQARIRQIFRATKTHALNLAKYVALYKTLLLLQKKSHGGKPKTGDPFIAGTIAGFAIFGSDRSAVNEQVVLYITARLVAAILPREGTVPAGAPPKPLPPTYDSFAFLAAATWGVVMWLFQSHPERIQPGMFNSMTYLYKDSDVFNDLRTLIWHNK